MKQWVVLMCTLNVISYSVPTGPESIEDVTTLRESTERSISIHISDTIIFPVHATLKAQFW